VIPLNKLQFFVTNADKISLWVTHMNLFGSAGDYPSDKLQNCVTMSDGDISKGWVTHMNSFGLVGDDYSADKLQICVTMADGDISNGDPLGSIPLGLLKRSVV
jgi:hypothetical protein